MSVHDVLAEKIADPELRSRVLDPSDEPVSVIIELALPDPKIEYGNLGTHEPTLSRPTRVAPMSDEERADLERMATEARGFLEELLDEPPVYLPSARAFVATTNGTQLSQIAQQPFTRRIERNRSLRA